jgi:L-rhamnose 1-dehydrogenase
METTIRLKDRVAIVTGAARGIGRAIALRFGQEGARIAVVDVRGGGGHETVGLIEAAGGQAIFLRTDVSDKSQVQAMVDAVVKQWGAVHVLVNVAGICPFEDFLEMGEDLWDQVLDVNLKGYFLCSQAVAKVMVEQGVKGRIIAVSSISSEFGGSSQAHYCASKATCNAVLPGTVETDINREALADPGVRDYWSQRAPLGRLGQPEDITGPALFFASDDSDWCTGSMLVVDGGTSVNLQ